MDGSNPPIDGTGFVVALLLVCVGLVLAGFVAWLFIREAGKAVRRHVNQSHEVGNRRGIGER